MKLSERIATGEDTTELREAIAMMIGWHTIQTGHATDIWARASMGQIGNKICPDYLADIRLTFADINRQGWNWLKCLDERGHTIYAVYTDDGSDIGRAVYDGNDARCACEALVIALEWVGI
jgi:hypothetical protein